MSGPTAWRRTRVAALVTALLFVVFATTTESQTSTSSFLRGWGSGTPMQVTGTITVMFADDFDKNYSEVVHFIRDEHTGRSFRVRFEDGSPVNPAGEASVTLTGRAVGSELYVARSGADISPANSTRITRRTASSTRAVGGDRRTLVMVANFIDATVACSVADVDNIMFSNPNGYSVAALYRDNSRGQLSFSGNVAGPFTIDARTTDACNPSAWGQLAEAAAAASGVDPTGYAHKVYVMPPNSCRASGYGTMSDAPGRAWVLSCGVQGIYAHELGHNLGMDHASDWTGEFGDWSDPMAMSTQQLRGLNAPHRHQLGWTSGPSVLDVTESGFYDVAPLAVDPSTAVAPQIVRLHKPDTGEFYYLSYRVGVGYDKYISDGYKELLSVHRHYAGSPTKTHLVAALADSKSFVDQANGITVTMISHGLTHATARVELVSSCPAGTPSVSLTPRDQRGSAGATAKYVISVTNNDGPSCPASTFTLGTTVPGGWEAVVSPVSLMAAPGASGSAELTMRSPSNASAGTYNLYVDVRDPATPVHGTLGNGTYTVQGDSIPPSAPSGVTASTNQKLKQIDVSWNASSDNVGVVAYTIIRNGSAVATAKATKWADAAWSPGASYTYTVVAYDQAGNASLQSNSVTVKLNGGEPGAGDGGKGGGKK